jgi:large subunit ribosomal protein L9
MQVIFLQDVDRVAHEGDLAEVADGYARNFLIPRGLAVKATKGALRELEERRSAIERRDAEKRQKADQLAEDLSERAVIVKATAGEGQRLHGQVTAQQIADAALEQLDIAIDRRDIDIPEPIRRTGDYLIGAQLYKDVAVQLQLSVVSDRETEDAETEEEEQAQPQEEDKSAAADRDSDGEAKAEALPETETETAADAEADTDAEAEAEPATEVEAETQVKVDASEE